MKKRIALARALIVKPKYLILDEPSTGLDPITAEEITGFLIDVLTKTDSVPIIITHDQKCIKAFGEYIIIMDKGQIIFQGSQDELDRSPDIAVKAYFAKYFEH